MNETTYASAIGASAMGYALPCGSFMVDPMMANTVKQNITRNVYQIGRLSHDLAGGFLATMPDEKALENPEIGDLVRKYHTANPDYDVDERIKLGRYIENMTSVTTMVEAMHGAGSPAGAAHRHARPGRASRRRSHGRRRSSTAPTTSRVCRFPVRPGIADTTAAVLRIFSRRGRFSSSSTELRMQFSVGSNSRGSSAKGDSNYKRPSCHNGRGRAPRCRDDARGDPTVTPDRPRARRGRRRRLRPRCCR